MKTPTLKRAADGAARKKARAAVVIAEVLEDALPAAIGSTDAGMLLSGCRIDLPPDDVVEEIEFERFFRLNLLLGSFDEPAGDVPAAAAAPGNAMSFLPAAGTSTGLDAIDPRRLPVALYMPFTQQWKLEGYNRGRVVNSFSLAPGEEQTIELFTWDRVRTSFESSTTFDSDTTTESSGTRRDVQDVSEDVSRQMGLEMTSGGKVGFVVGVVNVDITAGNTARAGVNEAEKSTRSSIVEATTRSANHVRLNRTLKVTESRETGREDRVTRKLRNPNVCHTLTIPFFEVLANYRVSTFVRTRDVRLVVLIASSELSRLRTFDRQSIRAHETTLRLALLDRALEPGLAAARMLDAKERACRILCHRCSCGESDFGPDSLEWNAVVSAARVVAAALDRLGTRAVYFPASVAWTVPVTAGGLGINPMVVAAGIADIQRYLFKKALADQAPRLIADLAGVGLVGGTAASVSVAQAQALARVISSLPPQALAFLRADPGLADRAGWEIYGAVLLFHPELVSAGLLAGGVRAATGGLAVYDDEGLVSALTAYLPAYGAWTKAQAAARANDETQAALERIAEEERDLRIMESFGLRETADAEERLDALLDHVNDPRNIDHYRFAVWNERSGAADDKVTALALAGTIDPTPVGVVGDALAVPIRLDRASAWQAFYTDSVADLVEQRTRDERRHILPTAALYSEAIVGECCACEPSMVTRQRLDADRQRLDNELLGLERDRLRARLDAAPPMLDAESARMTELVLVGRTGETPPSPTLPPA